MLRTCACWSARTIAPEMRGRHGHDTPHAPRSPARASERMRSGRARLLGPPAGQRPPKETCKAGRRVVSYERKAGAFCEPEREQREEDTSRVIGDWALWGRHAHTRHMYIQSCCVRDEARGVRVSCVTPPGDLRLHLDERYVSSQMTCRVVLSHHNRAQMLCSVWVFVLPIFLQL